MIKTRYSCLRPLPFIFTYGERKGLYFEENEDTSNEGSLLFTS